MSIKSDHYTGADSEGGITSSYATNDGVKLKVSYSFMGSIYDDAERSAAIAAMAQDSLTMGPKTQEFQDKFAKTHGTKYAFACSNCTTGMHVVTQLFDIKPGDEVIVTPNTFVATSLVILKEGAKPVFADIDPRTFNIDPNDVERKITSKTKAIYVVHYAGQMVDMDPIMEIAHKITEGIRAVPGVEAVYEDPNCYHSYHLYTVCVNEKELGASRDEFMQVLYQEEGVQGILHYQPTYHFTGLKRMGYDPDQCPRASEFFYNREFNIPMHPRLTEQNITDMIEGIKNTSAKLRKRHCKA